MPVRRIRRKQPYGGSSTHVSEQALRFQYRMRSRLTSCLGQGIAYFWLLVSSWLLNSRLNSLGLAAQLRPAPPQSTRATCATPLLYEYTRCNPVGTICPTPDVTEPPDRGSASAYWLETRASAPGSSALAAVFAGTLSVSARWFAGRFACPLAMQIKRNIGVLS